MFVPETRRDVHVASELAALVVVVPYLAWLSTRPQLTDADRWRLRALAAATGVVDGWLLYRWVRH